MRRTLITMFSCLAVATPVLAAEEAVPNFAEDTLTGDWGGNRSAAAKRGFEFEGLARIDALRNRGAISNGSRHISHLDFKLKMDLEKAAGWNGGSALINVLSDGGWGPNARHVGAQMGVTNVEVGAPTTTRLFQAWLQQSFLDDRLAVLAGLYPIDSEFFTMDSAGVFIGPQYGTPADLAQTRGPSIFNNSAFGLRAKWNITKSVYAMGALLDGIPNDPARPKRTAIRFAKNDGGFAIGELGWLPEADNDKFKGHAKAALGLWGYGTKVNDQRDLDAGGNPLQRSQQGGYILGERSLVNLGGEQERFITAFARYTWTDGDSTPVTNSINLGLHAKGPVASRPDDVLGFAWSRAGMSRKWRDAQAVPADTKSTEDVLEITWRFAVTPWLAIQPNYQQVRNPGGGSTPKARLLGARIDVTL
ncbi:MAG: carbohydrate porin [Sterolibacteriaceae bacterium]|uniref:carbohydrate porin n=1 Tax=Sulfuritalea sp. TaxID=2480090 RepID=UPI001A50DD00|nr:carbohydrate porin [Sulfuritalea sp.]MBL8479899.1 carbohydrate porin [Sterolibacteriaceae bacterium]MBN8476812.1 carbohydrate porin [Sulfuritalea sp.]